MGKRQLKFIIPVCIIAMLILIIGECLIGLVFDWGIVVSRIWLIVVIVLTCAFSVWKCPRD
ncbi:MAG: hypothetical protein IJZ64_09545 [Ruminococcus sp.]|nr:hypothetical protein [Ruminococcus sp.]